MGIPQSPVESKRETHPTNLKLNDLTTNAQRAIAFAWSADVDGYEEWLAEKKARVAQAAEEADVRRLVASAKKQKNKDDEKKRQENKETRRGERRA